MSLMRKAKAKLTLLTLKNPTYAKLNSLALVLMLGASMSACSFGDKWKEEVQLSNGKVIVIERQTVRERGGDEWAFNASGSKPKEYHIRFEYPEGSGKVVEWRSVKLSPTVRWPEQPLILDVENEKPMVFSDLFTESGCHTYIKYIYQAGSWVEEALPPVFEARKTNLLIRGNRDGLAVVNLAQKEKSNADVRARDFSRVGPKHPYCI